MKESEIYACPNKISLSCLWSRVEKLPVRFRLPRLRSICTLGQMLLLLCLATGAHAEVPGGASINEENDATSEYNYSQAKKLLEQHKWAEAIPILQSVLKSEPKSVPVWAGLAKALTY